MSPGPSTRAEAPRCQNACTGGVEQPALDALVTRVAARFMDASSVSAHDTLTDALQELSEFLHVDTSFLRSNDHENGNSCLVAEWPPRPNVPDPDPLGVVPFGADPVFDATRELAGPYVTRPSTSPDSYQERINAGAGVPQVSMAMVPLLRNAETTGVLGFVTFADRPWQTAEINALQAVASLVVQLQARVEAEERLQFQAYHDSLSGLPNRRALIEHLDQRLRDATPTTVLFLDLDRFKATNGFLGHSAGDHLLRVVGHRLRVLAGPEVMVCRLAGDEFVVVVGDDADVPTLCSALLASVRRPVVFNGHEIARTASIGVAAIDPTARTSEELIRNADSAMRKAKADGGDRSSVFDEARRRADDERAAIELGLREAIDHGHLRLHYQPEVDLATGRLTAFEALVRWERPGVGLQAAGAFITVAEETGLVVDLGRWVLSEAVRQMGVWLRRHPDLDFQMRINLSPAQLTVHSVVDQVRAELLAHDVPGPALCFEITEHAVMQDQAQATATLEALRALGVQLAIDDFGTGYSSMTQLKELPLDVLKIDQSFVKGLGEDAGDRAIIEAVVQLARTFELDIVAEGIETPQLLDQLIDLGCDRGQGYLLMRPSDPATLDDLIDAGRIDLDALRRVERP